LPQGVITLEGQNHAGKSRGEQDDGNRANSDKVNFLEQPAKPEGRHHREPQRLQKKQGHTSGLLNQRKKDATAPAENCRYSHEKGRLSFLPITL